MYLILLVLGLLIGAVFLAVLLVGDRKEARREAQQKALQEQAAQAGQPVEGAWPPPPSASTLPYAPPPAKTAATRAANRKMVRTFYLVRNGAIGVVVLAYIVYSCFPRLAFGWILLVTALAGAFVWGGISLVNKRRIR